MNIDKIIKGLTICSKGVYSDCKCCPYNTNCIGYGCTGELSADALLLISQLKAENDDLRLEIDDLDDEITHLQYNIEDLIALDDDLSKFISQLKAENDDLHLEIEGLYEEIDLLNDDILDLQITIDDLIESEEN